jgi:hypothetical protein
MSTIRVIAAVVDTTQLRLYKEDGRTIDILQGDKRLGPILTEITPILEAGLVATVDLREADAPKGDTTYADYEKKSKGFTRFFRLAKNKLASLMGAETEEEPVAHVAPVSLGSVPQANTSSSPKMSAAIADIMAHAEPVTAKGFDEADTTKDEVIIAVVNNGQGSAAVIPDVAKLKGHIGHAVRLNNTKGMEAFLQRLGAFSGKRGHTVDDVLRFMEKGDLPLADDGNIIAYKVLTSNGFGKSATTFYDCHTRKIPQKVGSFVHQDERLIDPSRSQECSTGLHIARRGYLGHFSGDIIVMVKIRPEDVIAVPHNEPNKIRVAGYHIIGRVPNDEHSKLRSNTAMQGSNALKLLTMAITGDHIGVTEHVRVTEAAGGGIVITPVEGADTSKPLIKKDTPTTPAVPDRVEPIKGPILDAPKVDPKKIAKVVVENRQAQTAPLTKGQQARVLYTAGKIEDLRAFKKASKKSWTALGFTLEEEKLLNTSGDSPITNGQPAVHPVVPLPVAAPAATTSPTPKELKMEGTRAKVARQLFDQAIAGDRTRWGSLWRHQKECKKSWPVLGFTAKEIERIKTNKPDWV